MKKIISTTFTLGWLVLLLGCSSFQVEDLINQNHILSVQENVMHIQDDNPNFPFMATEFYGCVNEDTTINFSDKEINEMISQMNKDKNIWNLVSGYANNSRRVAIDLHINTLENISALCTQFDNPPLFEFPLPIQWPPTADSEDFLSHDLSIFDVIKDDVIMEVTNIMDTTIDIKIINHSDFSLMTGYHFTIEFYQNGNWQALPVGMFFTDIGFSIGRGESFAMTKNLTFHLPIMEKGRYRIRKGLSVDVEPRQNHEVIAEFDWK